MFTMRRLPLLLRTRLFRLPPDPGLAVSRAVRRVVNALVPAVILARKLVRGEIAERGAMPALGLMSLAEFEAEAADLRIDTEVVNGLAPERNPHREPSPNPVAAK